MKRRAISTTALRDESFPAYPHSGHCDYCGRPRDDLFYHREDDAFYCCDVFRCEARAEILSARAISARRQRP